MTPEEIRRIFAEKADDQAEVERGIYYALWKLDLLLDPEDKATSPYSLSSLTMGLPNRDAIIDLALQKRIDWHRSRGGGVAANTRSTRHPRPRSTDRPRSAGRTPRGQTVP